MIVLEGLLAVACLLLIVAGGPKLVDPVPVAVLLRDVGLAATRATGRAVGLLELTVGAAGLVVTSPWIPATAAMLFAGFGIVLIAAIRRGSGGPCGCFGAGGSPPSWVHVTIDLFLAAGLVVASLQGTAAAWESTVTHGAWFPIGASAAAASIVFANRVPRRSGP